MSRSYDVALDLCPWKWLQARALVKTKSSIESLDDDFNEKIEEPPWANWGLVVAALGQARVAEGGEDDHRGAEGEDSDEVSA
ncbi:hypothetical protein MMC29_008120 [Sticta canariensis]|nr:hypothetical protein [Sticta canariensis]